MRFGFCILVLISFCNRCDQYGSFEYIEKEVAPTSCFGAPTVVATPLRDLPVLRSFASVDPADSGAASFPRFSVSTVHSVSPRNNDSAKCWMVMSMVQSDERKARSLLSQMWGKMVRGWRRGRRCLSQLQYLDQKPQSSPCPTTWGSTTADPPTSAWWSGSWRWPNPARVDPQSQSQTQIQTQESKCRWCTEGSASASQCGAPPAILSIQFGRSILDDYVASPAISTAGCSDRCSFSLCSACAECRHEEVIGFSEERS